MARATQRAAALGLLLRNQEEAGGARGRFGGNCGENHVAERNGTTASAIRGGRKDSVQPIASVGLAPASHSDKLPQAQTWPDPGGQTGAQD